MNEMYVFTSRIRSCQKEWIISNNANIFSNIEFFKQDCDHITWTSGERKQLGYAVGI